MKGVMRFGNRGKLSPRFIDPFEILRRAGELAYDLALSPRLSMIYPIFHVSILCRYIPNKSYVIPYDAVELGLNLTYEKEPVAILDR